MTTAEAQQALAREALAREALAGRVLAQDPPPGFAVLDGVDGLITHNGPLFVRGGQSGGLGGGLGGEGGDAVAIGCRILPTMCNPLGGAHGGWIATLCDVALPVSARLCEPALAGHFLLTVSLQVDFLGAVALGDWLEVRARVLRVTRRMAFVDGLAMVGETAVVRTSGVFRIGPPAPPVDRIPLDRFLGGLGAGLGAEPGAGPGQGAA